ncbi:protein DEHYDRATION-INDUCED 19 homolog 4 isoform X2 [Daucus carota subsp. sativus]|uniref:protein DEHYDRATION-INDUCED 19 homolog 4 isoform X2 n=1 Tax=Daucus carota subsp. sativus TaxID=79200 RepID=UPI0007EF72AB|nr:PREDICTED: protein DEHYDRATION-INDUCED 19 homolog 4-like isoform X2 [Daucus carota subsp. sativus]
MASDTWTRFSGSSRRSPFQPDPFSEEEDVEGGEEERPEYTCPFCAEDFDMVGLCCHLETDHKTETKNEVCSICDQKVGTDLVGHITIEHADLLKVQRRRRYRRASSLSFIRRELRQLNLPNVAEGSNWAAAAANTDADPLLSSFMSNPPAKDEQTSIEPRSSEKAVTVEGTSAGSSSERVQPPVLTEQEREERAEKARRSNFVQGLVMSSFFGNDDF